MKIELRHVHRVTAKGHTYYYHRITGRRLPSDPRSAAFLMAVAEETAKTEAMASAASRRKRDHPELNNVYFIEATSGRIKIGVAGSVKQRMVSIQNAHDGRLKLMASMPGGYEMERQLHRRFASARVSGEWFEPTPELLAYIDGVLQMPPD